MYEEQQGMGFKIARGNIKRLDSFFSFPKELQNNSQNDKTTQSVKEMHYGENITA